MSQLLFDLAADTPRTVALGEGAVVLHGFARARQDDILADLAEVVRQAPLRHMTTPGGHRMSVAMTSCGALGWVTDHTGYRYDRCDPDSGLPWPALPRSLRRLAHDAAAEAGFAAFEPDACLINRYAPGARMSLHQDRNEQDFTQPIVSVSLGLPAVFLFGGAQRTDRPLRVGLEHGDVVVWGGPARLRYHGVLPLEGGHHPATGGFRFNLTFRRAGPADR